MPTRSNFTRIHVSLLISLFCAVPFKKNDNSINTLTHSRSVWMKFMMGTSTCHSVWASHNDDNFVAVEWTTLIKCVYAWAKIRKETNSQHNTKQGNKTNNNMRDSCQSLLLPSLSLPSSEICDWFDYTRHNYSFSFVTRNDFWPRGKKLTITQYMPVCTVDDRSRMNLLSHKLVMLWHTLTCCDRISFPSFCYHRPVIS